MLKEIPLITGNTLTFAGATFATITHNDFSGWSLAIIGVLVTIGAGYHKHKREEFSSMRERIALCKECQASGLNPETCVVAKKFRCKNCHLNNN